jgi:hypothetical protein
MHQVESTKIPHLVLIVVVFITVMILLTPTLPVVLPTAGTSRLQPILKARRLASPICSTSEMHFFSSL